MSSLTLISTLPFCVKDSTWCRHASSKPFIRKACWRKGHLTLSYAFLKSTLKTAPSSFFVEHFMKDHNPFEDVPIWHESRLRRLYYCVRNLCEPDRPNLGKIFETNIHKTDRPKLLDSHGLCFLWEQGYCSKIKLEKLQMSREQIMEHRHQVPFDNMPTLLVKLSRETIRPPVPCYTSSWR